MDQRLFLEIDPLPDAVRAQLPKLTALIRAQDEASDGLEAWLDGRGPEVRAISSRGKRRIDGALFDLMPNLELVACYGVGYDKVDAAEATRRGISVTHTPDVLNEDVADLAVALLLATIRRLPQAERFLRAGNWMKEPFPLTATLRQRLIGIVGMGRIGQAIAQRLAAFDLEIAYHTRTPVPSVPYRHVDALVDLAAEADVLIVIVPGGAATNHLIDAEVLSALGAEGVLINVSRGSVVDQDALVKALESGTIAAAGLDVYQDEPSVPPELLALDSAVLLPHIGSATRYTRAAMNSLYLDNVVAWLERRPLPTPVPETTSGDLPAR